MAVRGVVSRVNESIGGGRYLPPQGSDGGYVRVGKPL